MSHNIYMDHAATTPMRNEVSLAMRPFEQDEFGNPSTIYQLGSEAHEALSLARHRVASTIGAGRSEVIFTSGGTEADNLAVKGTALASLNHGRHIVISSVEHPAVDQSASFLEANMEFEVTRVPVDEYGFIKPADVGEVLRNDTTLVSIMYANNEVGTIQDIAEISAVIKEKSGRIGRHIPLHTDAVQAAGYLDLDVNDLGVDLMTLSGHKIGGPKGTGVLYRRSGIELEPQIHGGGQEFGLRSGTENVGAWVGFSKALALANGERKKTSRHCKALQKLLIEGVSGGSASARLTGHPNRRLPNNAHFTFEGLDGDQLVAALSTRGICVSTGSACHSGSPEPSTTLLAMGVSRERAWGSIRFTLGADNTETEVDYVVSAIFAIESAAVAQVGKAKAGEEEPLAFGKRPISSSRIRK
jgi:cysteine desulfurase